MKLNEVTYAIVKPDGTIPGGVGKSEIGHPTAEAAQRAMRNLAHVGWLPSDDCVIRAVKLVPVNRSSDPPEIHHQFEPDTDLGTCPECGEPSGGQPSREIPPQSCLCTKCEEGWE